MVPEYSDRTYGRNLERLKLRFPAVYRRLQKPVEAPRLDLQPIKTPDGEIEWAGSFDDGRQIFMHEGPNTACRMGRKMRDWQPEAHDTLIFCGLGLGCGPMLAVKLYKKRPRIVVVENQPSLLDRVLHLIDLRPLFEYNCLELYVEEDMTPEAVVSGLEKWIPFGTTRLITHSAYPELFGRSFIEFFRQLQDGIGLIRDRYQTSKKFGQGVIAHTLNNFASLAYGLAPQKLLDRFAGLPAVCVAAGPSLDTALPHLKAIGNRALILACDSAVPVLAAHDIQPHMVVTVDMNPINFEKIRPYAHLLRQALLVFGIDCNPDNVRAFLGMRRVAVTADNTLLNTWIGPRCNRKFRIPAMTSVSQAAILAARAFGSDPIVLVGVDLAVYGEKSHAGGSVFCYRPQQKNMTRVDGVDGSPVATLPQLLADKVQLERIVRENGPRYINTSLNGAFIEGMEIRPLAEFLANGLKETNDVTAQLADLSGCGYQQLPGVVTELKAMLGRMNELRSLCLTGCELAGRTLAAVRSGEHRYDRLVRQVNSHLEAFQQNQADVLLLLESARLESIEALHRRRSWLDANADRMDTGEHRLVQLEIIRDFFRSVSDTADLFATSLDQTRVYLEEVVSIEEIRAAAAGEANVSMRLARLHADANQLWLADQCYRQVMASNTGDPTPWQELTALYLRFRLTTAARMLLLEAEETFEDTEWLDSLRRQLSELSENLLEQARMAVENGNLILARRQLAEFRMLVPNTQPLELHGLIGDAEDNRSFRNGGNGSSMPHESAAEAKLMEMALSFFRRGKPERTIGILEGLARRIPAKAVEFREKIGDCRHFLQDYKSAAWHYRQALRLAPSDTALAVKHEKACRACRAGDPRREEDECISHTPALQANL